MTVRRYLLPVLWMATALGLSTSGASAADKPGDEPDGQAEPLPEGTPAVLQEGTQARLLKPKGFPNYPLGPRSRGQEGWVVLSYSVSPEGKVVDPIVEDSSGIAEFERAALASALKYRYSPATWNGKPVEQCATQVRFTFMIGQRRQSVRASFAEAYRETVALADEQRAAEAEAKLDEMTAKGAWNNYESSKLWLLRSTFQAAKGDKAGQLRSLRRAAMFDGRYIQPKYYPQVLRAIFVLEVEQMQYGAALETHSKLKNRKPTEAEPAPEPDLDLDKVVVEIQEIVDGPNALGFPGVVEYRSGCAEGRPNWQHELLRRKFTFDSIEGQVDDFELRCEWKRVVDKVSTEKTWEVPDSWGWCQVFVFGEIGAKAKLVEYPLPESQRGIRRKPNIKH